MAMPCSIVGLTSANSCITTSPPRALIGDLLQVYFFLSAFLQLHRMRVVLEVPRPWFESGRDYQLKSELVNQSIDLFFLAIAAVIIDRK